jgi:probable HAF family extracellular repeat protein
MATGINNAGQVVGISANSADGTITDIRESFDIGSQGTNQNRSSFLYSDGKMTQIAPLGAVAGREGANAINDSGQVVGGAFSSINNQGQYVGSIGRGFVLVSGGATTQLGNFVPVAINDAGQIVGWLASSQAGFPNGNSQDVAIYQNGKITDLVATEFGPFAGNGMAYAINQAGDMLLYYADKRPGETGVHHYMLRLANGQTIETNPGINGNGPPVALNDKDQIIGRDYLFSDGRYMLLRDLIPTSSGWSDLAARAINDKGQIVGEGRLADGAVHAFLMTPVPEPSAVVLPALVLAWLGLRSAVGTGVSHLRRASEPVPDADSASRTRFQLTASANLPTN